MFAPVMVEPGEVTILRINQEFISKEESVIKSENKPPQVVNQTAKAPEPKFIGQDTSLTLDGFTNEGEVLMQYNNKAQQISQTFAFGLKYYKPHL